MSNIVAIIMSLLLVVATVINLLGNRKLSLAIIDGVTIMAIFIIGFEGLVYLNSILK